MPPPRKVDQLPAELRGWLQEELKARGFGGYVELADALNWRLEEAGLELRIGKSAVAEYGAEYQEFARVQEEASSWAQGWMQNNGVEDEAQRHNVLFQMLSTLAFKQMQSQMTKDAAAIDTEQLDDLGKVLDRAMRSAGVREKILAEERKRQAEERRRQEAALSDAAENGDIDSEAAQKAREIMGFA